MKAIRKVFRWSTFIIVILFLGVSILSWAKFAKNFKSIFFSLIQIEDNGVDSAGEALEQGINKTIESDHVFSLFEITDTYIDKFSSAWKVYKDTSLSKIDSLTTYYITKEITSIQVLLGKDRWLFYKSTTDGDPIADYEGKNIYSLNLLDEILESASEAQQELQKREIQFSLFVAPNKENIYSEFMPDNYIHSETSRTDILIEYLEKNDINIISPKQEMLNQKEKEQLYYSYDTHWNQLGAYLGVRELLIHWGISLPELSDRIISCEPLKGHYHYCAEDDLAKMIGLLGVFDDEIEYKIEGTPSIDWQQYEKEQTAEEVSFFFNPQAVRNEVVLLVGDSFRTSMIPALSEVFSDVYVLHRSFYDSSMLDEIDPDYVIAEYVERYSESIREVRNLVA